MRQNSRRGNSAMTSEHVSVSASNPSETSAERVIGNSANKSLAEVRPAAACCPDSERNEGGKQHSKVSPLRPTSRFKEGTDNDLAGAQLLAQAVILHPYLNMEKNDDECFDSSVAILHGIGPRDQIEGLLAVQMLAVHFIAMKQLEKAADDTRSTELRESSMASANRLLRTFALQLDALNRHRGKADHQMIVGSLNISDGSQAIVGPVSHMSSKKVCENDDDK
jgi:hypothetical protein